MDLGKKIAVLFLLLTIGISTKMVIDKEINTDIPEISGQSSSWLYRRGIYIEDNEYKTLFEQERELEIDTKELISKGKLQPNCNDIRFLDEDNETPLQYHIEENNEGGNLHGCNSKETKIWVKIPAVGPDGKIIYFLYGNNNAPDFQTYWEVK